MSISVVIPNYNGSKILRENLPKILTSVGDAEVIVVDDASTDDSIILVKKYFPKVKIIDRKKNEGFASSANDGVKIASRELILLLNSDVTPQKDFLKYLTSHFSDPYVFAVGCMQKIGNQMHGRGVGRFKKGFLMHESGSPDKKNTLWVFGGAGMFRKIIWDKLGGMDKIYNPFYWEDIDLSYRALKAGYKLVFESRSIVYHHQNKGAIRSFYSLGKIKTIAYRNQILFIWLNITDLSYIINHIVYMPYHLVKAAAKFDFPFITAFLSVIYKIPQIIHHRLRNQGLSMLDDGTVLATWAS